MNKISELSRQGNQLNHRSIKHKENSDQYKYGQAIKGALKTRW